MRQSQPTWPCWARQAWAPQALLTTIGTATYGGSDYNLIWDDNNNGNSVVWLDYTTNSATDWASQKAWAAGLDSSLTYNIDPDYTVDWVGGSWRLPSAGANPSSGYNVTTSEMGHLFYEELGLDSAYTTAAELNAGEFDKLIASWYWTGSEFGALPWINAWLFYMPNGYQDYDGQVINSYGLAVRSGQVSVVSEPATMLLFGTGLAGLAGTRFRRKKK